MDGDFIEEMTDSVHIFADDIISHSWCQSSVRQSHKVLTFLGLRYLLEETLGIKIQHASVGRVELFISDLPDILAAITLVPKNARSLNEAPLILSIISMIIEVFVLVNTHFHVISWLVALSGVSACVVDHNSLQVDDHLS